jgi:chaperone modulatory protein CbpM
MNQDLLDNLCGELLDEDTEYSLAELCRHCGVPAECLLELVEEGVIVPRGQAMGVWRFSSISIVRVQRALRLRRDLGVNLAGAALALDLLDEMERLRARLRRFEQD